MQPKLIIEQKITALVNQYAVYETQTDGSKGRLVAFAQQKRLAFKEKVIFYADEQKTTPLFSFRAEKVMDVHGRFLVEDINGDLLGSFHKIFRKSLLISTWQILNIDNQPSLTVAENSKVLAILRRTVGFVPFVGEFLEILIMFFKYHFNLTDDSNAIVGTYHKTTLFRDHYLLEMTDSAYNSEDWRVLAAQAVALDALQSR